MRAMMTGRGVACSSSWRWRSSPWPAAGAATRRRSGASAATTRPPAWSADQIVKDSEAKMATVNSAAFTADFALQVQGDTAKMTDPTAKALLGQGVTFTPRARAPTTRPPST